MTLEWLLIVAAVAGLSAGTVLAVQRVLDETTDVPVRPGVSLIDAEVAAALVVTEAQGAELAGDYVDVVFEVRCVSDIPAAFGDVVVSAEWSPRDPDTLAPPRCVVTARSDLSP